MADEIAYAPGQVVTVFRSRVRPEAEAEFRALAVEMRAAAEAMPGFVDYKVYVAEDGERVSVIVFATAEHQRAWRDDPRHQEAQKAGRDRFYSAYSMQISTCTDAWSFGPR
ncbi:antibiotic biosynthesis monooxygenase family protein [Yinghuangia soli]|uniref:Antibiotic biosynthesis monooxygenase n=1 Tax=Yinghuangia soli TaxID=2908204 RepID=A0AA41PZ32_9ACTN|nr:antibiotic biosynthesis monooxygenase [Yinghuangia soli]MCF2527781.1 antibiotic biosynthesis monooxygenase [Yinghuangia soli]